MTVLTLAFVGCVSAVAFMGCGGDPADVQGGYTMAITNRDNGCNFQNWTVGQQSTGVQITITQDGANASATVEGAAGGFWQLWFGSRTYTGKVDGDDVSLDLFGMNSQNTGNCAFTYNSRIVGTASGDALSGRVEYRAATNGNPDCTPLEGCLSFQDFNGSRPPR